MACRHVRFNESLNEYIILDDVHEDRKSYWIRDRMWFEKRVFELDIILKPLLERRLEKRNQLMSETEVTKKMLGLRLGDDIQGEK